MSRISKSAKTVFSACSEMLDQAMAGISDHCNNERMDYAPENGVENVCELLSTAQYTIVTRIAGRHNQSSTREPYGSQRTKCGDGRVQQHMQELQNPRPFLQRIGSPPAPSIHSTLYTRCPEIGNETDIGQLRKVRELSVVNASVTCGQWLWCNIRSNFVARFRIWGEVCGCPGKVHDESNESVDSESEADDGKHQWGEKRGRDEAMVNVEGRRETEDAPDTTLGHGRG